MSNEKLFQSTISLKNYLEKNDNGSIDVNGYKFNDKIFMNKQYNEKESIQAANNV